jgi:hypothetical protein
VGLLDDRKDAFLFAKLVGLWREYLGLNQFVKPKAGVKTQESVAEFVALAGRLDKPIEEMMAAACARYSPGWCQETLKQSYPPFPMVVSKSSRKWLAREFKKPPIYKSSEADLERQAGEVVSTLLGSMTLENARLVVEGGWPADRDLRVKVAAELYKRGQV